MCSRARSTGAYPGVGGWHRKRFYRWQPLKKMYARFCLSAALALSCLPWPQRETPMCRPGVPLRGLQDMIQYGMGCSFFFSGLILTLSFSYCINYPTLISSSLSPPPKRTHRSEGVKQLLQVHLPQNTHLEIKMKQCNPMSNAVPL